MKCLFGSSIQLGDTFLASLEDPFLWWPITKVFTILTKSCCTITRYGCMSYRKDPFLHNGTFWGTTLFNTLCVPQCFNVLTLVYLAANWSGLWCYITVSTSPSRTFIYPWCDHCMGIFNGHQWVFSVWGHVSGLGGTNSMHDLLQFPPKLYHSSHSFPYRDTSNYFLLHEVAFEPAKECKLSLGGV